MKGKRKSIDPKIVDRVKALKSQNLPLKKIKKETRLSMRQIKFILYERQNPRVNALVAERMKFATVNAEGRDYGVGNPQEKRMELS
jgi:hypothetical protein